MSAPPPLLTLSCPSGARAGTHHQERPRNGLCVPRHGTCDHPAGLGALHRDQQGHPPPPHPEWWLQSQRGITPRREGGGAYHAIVGTVEMALICAAIAVPIGILGAIFLIEYAKGTKVARAVSFTVDILSGSPPSSPRFSSTRCSLRSSGWAAPQSRCPWPWYC